MKKIILIGDELVKNIPVIENNNPMIDLLVDLPELLFDHNRLHVQKISKSISYSRKEVGERLILAQSILPFGIKLLIKECYRPMRVQKKSWDSYYQYLQEKYPSWSETEIYNECSKLNAPLDVAPHTTGAAVDLTLIDSQGNWLEMGSEFNASPLECEDRTYTDAENISEKAIANRKILIDVMSKAGFVNYPTEWWHWSYGDKYWALMTNTSHALYSSIELGL